MKKEYWKPVVGYEGLYEVSNWGRVKGLDRWVKSRWGSIRICKGRIMKSYTNKSGYLYVVLCKNNKHKTYKIHRLVAEAFLPNPDNLPQVNHRDENKLNNNAENLEWCSAKYNTNFGTAIKRRSLKKKKSVLQYTLDGEFVREWESVAECSRNGFSSGNICMCCRGERKTHKGFIWRYK